MRRKEFTEQQINEMKELYNNGISLKNIGEKFKVSRSVITRVFKENEITIQKDNHKYKADYRVFEKIDSPEKAYWLGFLAADGTIYQRLDSSAGGDSVILNIHQKDRMHLEKFKIFMKSNVNIQDYISNDGFSNNTPMCKIVFNSKLLVQDLIDKNVTPRKSLTLQVPNINSEYYLPFILGYFDGDGSISYNTAENIYSLSIVGTKEILLWINSLLNISETNNLEKRIQNDKNTYYIRCGGTRKPYLILKKLYESCPIIHLDRKYLIYKNLSQSFSKEI